MLYLLSALATHFGPSCMPLGIPRPNSITLDACLALSACLGLSYVPRGCPGPGSMHALASATCLWRYSLALAAACLGLGYLAIGLP